MFNKEDNADTDIGAIGKKVLVGAIFITLVHVGFPALTGVDIYKLCVLGDEERGDEIDEDGCKVTERTRLSEGIVAIKALVVLGVDLFIIGIVLAMIGGPGLQAIRYQFVAKNAPY